MHLVDTTAPRYLAFSFESFGSYDSLGHELPGMGGGGARSWNGFDDAYRVCGAHPHCIRINYGMVNCRTTHGPENGHPVTRFTLQLLAMGSGNGYTTSFGLLILPLVRMVF